MKIVAFIALLALAFFAGGTTSGWLSGDLAVMRNQNEQCVIVDTNSGNALGNIDKRNGRCHIADWRVRHPF